MKLEQKILEALRRNIKEAGGKTELASRLHLQHAVINRIDTGVRKVKNMSVGTLEKLFPEAEIVFSPRDATGSEAEVKKIKHAAEEAKLEYDRKLAALEKDRRLFELEKENWHLRCENSMLKNVKSEQFLHG